MSSPKAAIIAGGLGTRIRSISGDMMPKALVPVNGEPIIALQLDLLARYGVKEIAVLCGHLADALIAGMTSLCEKRGLKVEFFVEREPLGTAGNFASAREFLSGGDFFVVNLAEPVVGGNCPRIR